MTAPPSLVDGSSEPGKNVKRFRKMRIGTRLALLFFSVTVTPLVILGSAIYAQSYSVVRQQVFRVLENSATNLKWRIELLSEHYFDTYSSLVQRAQLRDSLLDYTRQKDPDSQQRLKSLLTETVQGSRVFLRLDLYDGSGNLITSTSDTARSSTLAERDRITEPQHNNRFLTFRRIASSTARMEMASELKDGDTRIGFIRAIFDLTPFKKLCERPLGVGSTEDVVLITSTATGLPAFVTPPKLFRTDPPLEETLRESEQSLTITQNDLLLDNMSDYRGESVIAVSRPIDTMNWNLLVKLDQKEVFAPLVAIRTFILGSCSLLLLLVIGLSRMIARSFTRPIQALSEAAHELREGQLDSRVHIREGGGEIQETCVAFNQMAEQLQHSHRLLTEQVRSLAERDHRTRAMLNSALDAVISVNSEGKVVEWNPAAEIMFGHPRDVAIGQLLIPLISPSAYRSKYMESFAHTTSAVDTMTPSARFEAKAVRKNGDEFPVEFTVCSASVQEQILLTSYIRDLSRQKEAEEQNLLLSSILKGSEDAIIGEDLQGIIRVWNQGASRILGWDGREVIGKHASAILPGSLTPADSEIEEASRLGKSIETVEIVRKRKDGTSVYLSLSISPIRTSQGELVGRATIARDITEKRLAEDLMRASLHEKELLLKEVHHRVKNNMQVISSLLKLQSEYLGDDGARRLFKQSDERIRSMAIIHERLYRAETLSEIDLAEYIKELTSFLLRSHSVRPERITVNMNLLPIQLGIDQAIPCGLLLNECISNAFKHAFNPETGGELTITLGVDGEDVMLSIADNGKGLPANFDPMRPESMGFEIVRTLTEQLQGSLEVQRAQGTDLIFRFRNMKAQQQRRKDHGTRQHLSM